MRKFMSLILISVGSVFLANGLSQGISLLLIGGFLLIVGVILAYWEKGSNRHEISLKKEG